MDNKPLYIPKSKRWKGLTVYCKKCLRNVSEICRETGKPLRFCPFGESHIFKVYSWIPGSDNGRKTKNFKTRDINEAIRLSMEFEEQVKNEAKGLEKTESISITEINNSEVKEIKTEKEVKPVLLVHCIVKYLSWLCGEGVPAHEWSQRSSDYLAEVERVLKYFIDCLRQNGHNVASFSIGDISNEIAGEVYSYFLEIKKFSPAYFNKNVGILVSFVSWVKEELGYDIRNWFERIKRKEVHYNPETIAREEFEAFMEKVNEKNGIKEYEKGEKKVRNFYRNWLPIAYLLSLHTGLRREELISLKFSSICDYDKDGTPDYMEVENFKVNHIQRKTDDREKEWKYAPVTKKLYQILLDLGYEKNKGKDVYLIANEIQHNRNGIMPDILSRAFSHFYEQLGTEKKLHFGCLRKTYITELNIQYPTIANFISGHSNSTVVGKHYINRKKMAAEVAKDFDVFPEGREQELSQVRAKNKNQKISLER